MVKETQKKIQTCPYCGSEKLTRIDWGFADWECETCRNNFKKPYSPKKEPERNHSSNEKKFSVNEFAVTALGYSIAAFLIFCVIVCVIFFFVRIYQIFTGVFI